jgi:hypothetical protein
MKKIGDMILFELAHREGDYVYIDKDGMNKMFNMLGLASRRRKEAFAKEDCSKDTWNASLIEQDKIMTELFRSAKEIRIKVDWDKWEATDKKISRELKRVNR